MPKMPKIKIGKINRKTMRKDMSPYYGRSTLIESTDPLPTAAAEEETAQNQTIEHPTIDFNEYTHFTTSAAATTDHLHFHPSESSTVVTDSDAQSGATFSDIGDIGIEPFPQVIHNADTENAPVPPGLHKKKRMSRRETTSEEPITMSDEQIKQNGKDILDAIEVNPQGGRTYIIAVAVHEKQDETSVNRQRAVVCRRGTPFTKGYPYNQAQDAYMMQCVEHMELGHVACVFEANMPGTGWKCSVPLPEVVLDRMLSASQKKKLSGFRGKFPQPEYKVQLVQMLGCDY